MVDEGDISAALNTYTFPHRLGNTVYEFDYFSGSQTLVYFEEVLVDDIARIAWGVKQNRTPIYGYASQYYNAVASGNVLGQGSFWIDFKEAGYIPVILGHIALRKDPSEPTYISPAGDRQLSLGDSARAWIRGRRDVPDSEARQSREVTRANIERLLESRRAQRQAGGGDAASGGDEQTDAALRSLLLDMGAMDDRAFENSAEIFEDALWYGGNSSDGRRQLNSGNFAGGELGEEAWLAYRRADQYPPFDIIVTFGDINNSAANHTVHRMLDVTIVGSEFEGIASTGEPIAVRYDFFCRNIT